MIKLFGLLDILTAISLVLLYFGFFKTIGVVFAIYLLLKGLLFLKSVVSILDIISGIFILLAVKHYLSLFSVMYSKQGIVVGAGYADVVAYLPIIRILMILAIIVALIFVGWMLFFSKQLKKMHILGYVVLVYLIFGFVGPTVIPALVQAFIVTPNEINLERPYIENNIKFTRMAYGLSDVEERDFSVEMDLTADKLAKASKTINNIRILDWRPLVKTYKQTQEIRLYYELSGIDIDRYYISLK